MGCDIHIRAEIRRDGGWFPAGRVFDSDRESVYLEASEAILDELTDGQLLDAVSNAFGRDYWADFYAKFSEESLSYIRSHKTRLETDAKESDAIYQEWRRSLAQWRSDNPAEAKEWDGFIGDDHPLAHSKMVKPRVRDLVQDRRDAVSLPSNVRSEIISVSSAYTDEDGEKRKLHLTRGKSDPLPLIEDPWEGRNYDLFAILADVRNGRGFAGVPTGEGFYPIADPRGIPEDAHPETREFLESYGVDGHSHSWHDLEALREYDWSQTTRRYGVVAADVYDRLRSRGETPKSWCGGVSGPGITTFTESAYAAWVEAGRPTPPKDAPGIVEHPLHEGEIKPYVRMSWRVSYREAAGDGWANTMDRLEELVPEGGSRKDVRVVFFFDN